MRSGMTTLIDRLRRLVDDADSSIWTPDELQDILDTHRWRVDREPLEMEMTRTSGTAYEYKRFHSRYGNFEAGGTAYFHVQDSAGSARYPSTDYTADYIGGVVTTTVDQGGTALYLMAWTYDLPGAASDCWRERATKVASYYNVNVDGHQLSRSQWFMHCQKLADMFAAQARAVTVRQWQSGLFSNE